MKIWTKRIEVPFSNETRQIEVAQLWEVRWESRYSEYLTQPEMEGFPSEQEARDFAESLRNAYKLLRHSSGTSVTVRKAR